MGTCTACGNNKAANPSKRSGVNPRVSEASTTTIDEERLTYT